MRSRFQRSALLGFAGLLRSPLVATTPTVLDGDAPNGGTFACSASVVTTQVRSASTSSKRPSSQSKTKKQQGGTKTQANKPQAEKKSRSGTPSAAATKVEKKALPKAPAKAKTQPIKAATKAMKATTVEPTHTPNPMPAARNNKKSDARTASTIDVADSDPARVKPQTQAISDATAKTATSTENAGKVDELIAAQEAGTSLAAAATVGISVPEVAPCPMSIAARIRDILNAEGQDSGEKVSASWRTEQLLTRFTEAELWSYFLFSGGLPTDVTDYARKLKGGAPGIATCLVDLTIRMHSEMLTAVQSGLEWEVKNLLSSERSGSFNSNGSNAPSVVAALTGNNSNNDGSATGGSLQRLAAGGRLGALEMAVYLVHFEPVLDEEVTKQPRPPKYISATTGSTKQNSEQQSAVSSVIVHIYCPLRNTLIVSHKMRLSDLPPSAGHQSQDVFISDSSSATSSAAAPATSSMLASLILSDMISPSDDESIGSILRSSGVDGSSATRKSSWEFVEKLVELSRGLTKILCIPVLTTLAVANGGNVEWMQAAQQRLGTILSDGGLQSVTDVNVAGILQALLRSNEMRRAVQSTDAAAAENPSQTSSSTPEEAAATGEIGVIEVALKKYNSDSPQTIKRLMEAPTPLFDRADESIADQPLHTWIADGSSSGDTVPASALEPLQAWFRGYWQLISQCASRSGIDGTPFSVITSLMMPRAEIHTLNLVQHGSQGISIAIYSTAVERKRVASGSLVLVCRELLALPGKHIILLPTERTDRQLLQQCRAVLAKEGKLCSVIHPSMMMKDTGGLRGFKSNFPDLYWKELQERTELNAADLAWELRYMAGRQLRMYLSHKDDALKDILQYSRSKLEEDEIDEANTKEADETVEVTSDPAESSAQLEALDPDMRAAVEAATPPLETADIAALAAISQQKDSITSSPARWLAQFQQNPLRSRAEAEFARLHTKKYLVMDGITTDHHGFGRANNPTLSVSRLTSAGWRDNDGTTILPNRLFLTRDEFAFPDLSSYDVLVLHDAKTVLSHVWCHPALRAFIARGGLVWCTMEAEYLLSGQKVRSGYNTLLEVAMRHSAYDSGAAALLASIVGISRKRVPLSLQAKLLGISTGLIAQTYVSQIKLAQQQHQLISSFLRMDAVLSMAEMEHQGLRIDVETASSRAKDLNNRLIIVDNALETFLPRQVPMDSIKHIDWSHQKWLHAYFFGGFHRLGQTQVGRYIEETQHAEQQRETKKHVDLPKGGVEGEDSYENEVQRYHMESMGVASPKLAAVSTTATKYMWDSSSESPLMDELITAFQLRFQAGSTVANTIAQVAVYARSIGINPSMDKADFMINEHFKRRYEDELLRKTGSGPLTSNVIAAADQPVNSDPTSNKPSGDELSALPPGGGFLSHKQRSQYTHLVPKSLAPKDFVLKVDNSAYMPTFKLFTFDVEATGLNPDSDEIVELAFYCPSTDKSFSSLVNPIMKIPNRVTRLHQITQTMVKNAPTIHDLLPRIIQFLGLKFKNSEAGRAACIRLGLDPAKYVRKFVDYGGSQEQVTILMSHSCFLLDEPLIRKALRLEPEIDTDRILFADSVPIVKLFRRDRRSNVDRSLLNGLRLEDLRVAFRLSSEGESHRAEGDARDLWRVLDKGFSISSKQRSDPELQFFSLALTQTIVLSPGKHAFVNSANGERKGVSISFPGVAHQYLPASQVQRLGLRSTVSNETLKLLAKNGCAPAKFVLEKQLLERHTARFMQFSQSGSLVIVHPDKCVRQEIDTTITSTSRTTSSSPSCQNIPKGDDSSLIRSVYISRFGLAGRCVEIDYGQLEVGVLAVLSNDPTLIKELNDGVDFHCKRAAFFEHAARQITNDSYNKAMAAASLKGASVEVGSGGPRVMNKPRPMLPVDELYKIIHDGYLRGDSQCTEMRRQAKIVSFQRMYGGGIHLISKTTNLPINVLREAIEEEERQYPLLKKFHQLVRNTCLRINNPGLPTHFTFELPTGFRISFDPKDVKHGLPPLKNYPIQGYSAELVQFMVGKLFRHFATKSNYGEKAFIVNFVHDSVWIDCHKSVLEEMTKDAVTILSSMPSFVINTIPGARLPIEMPVVAQAGMTFGALKPVMRTTHDGKMIVNDKALQAVVESGGLDAKCNLPMYAAEMLTADYEGQVITAGQAAAAAAHVTPDVEIISNNSHPENGAHIIANGEHNGKNDLTSEATRSKARKLQKDVARLRSQQACMSASASATLIPHNTFLPDEDEIDEAEADAEDSEKF